MWLEIILLYIPLKGDLVMQSGIYKITCRETGKIYVGGSVNMRSRFCVHKSDLKRGKHGNPHMKKMYEKYGVENFIFSVIEICEKGKIKEREQFWIDKLQSYKMENGFNYHRFSTHKKSIIHKYKDPKEIKKVSEKSKEKWKDLQFREKTINALKKGHEKQIKKLGCLGFNTKESKEKMIKACSTKEYREKRSKIRKAELATEEGKRRNKELLERARKSPKRIENLRKHNKKKNNDPEFKKKIKNLQKELWKDPEHRAMRLKKIKEGKERRKKQIGIG